MNLAKLALDHSRITIIAMLMIVALGLSTYLTYPSAEDPTIKIRSASVTASFPGMSAERIEDLIAVPLEAAMREIAEIDEITSISKTGSVKLKLEIRDEVSDLGPVFQDIRNKAEDVKKDLPEGTQGPFVNDEEGLTAIAEVQFRRDLSPRNRLIVGAEYQDNYESYYRVWDDDEDGFVYFDQDHPYSVVSLYVQDEHQLTPDLALTVGLRRDRYSMVGNTTTPRGALVYHPSSSSTLKLLYGEAFRAPGMYEVHYEDDQIKRNPDLSPEEIKTTELVWEQELKGGLTTTASLYRYTMRQLIDQVVDPTDGLVEHRNVEKVEATGLEVELSGRFARGISAHTSYVFQRARDAKEDRRLTNQPSHVLKGGLNMPVGGNSYVSPEVRYESSRKTLYDTETEPYLLVDLRLVIAPQRSLLGSVSGLSEHVDLSLTVRNLLDTAYATPGGWEHLQPAIGQDGRSYRLSLDFAF